MDRKERIGESRAESTEECMSKKHWVCRRNRKKRTIRDMIMGIRKGIEWMEEEDWVKREGLLRKRRVKI